MSQQVKNPPAVLETQEMQVWSLGLENPLEEEMATHSSILAWKILWTEDPGGLQSTGSQSRTQLSKKLLLQVTFKKIKKENTLTGSHWIVGDQWLKAFSH